METRLFSNVTMVHDAGPACCPLLWKPSNESCSSSSSSSVLKASKRCGEELLGPVGVYRRALRAGEIEERDCQRPSYLSGYK